MKRKYEEFKEKIQLVILIAMISVFLAAVDHAYCNTFAKPIPHSTCGWYYIGDSIITDCGYKITDGCPNCGKKINISESEETEK